MHLVPRPAILGFCTDFLNYLRKTLCCYLKLDYDHSLQASSHSPVTNHLTTRCYTLHSKIKQAGIAAKSPSLVSGNARFESQPEHRLIYMRFFVSSSVPPDTCWVSTSLCNHRSHPKSFHFIIHQLLYQ